MKTISDKIIKAAAFVLLTAMVVGLTACDGSKYDWITAPETTQSEEVIAAVSELSEEQKKYFEAVVELNDPLSEVREIIDSKEYPLDDTKDGLKAQVDKYIEKFAEADIETYEYIKCLPEDSLSVFCGWFYQQELYSECLSAVKDAYKKGNGDK